jgi:hypothetical protein
MTSTLAARRRRTRIMRNIAWALLLIMATSVVIAWIIFRLPVDVVGGSTSLFTDCGSPSEPAIPLGDDQIALCAGTLREQFEWVWGFTGLAAAALLVAIVLYARNPRRGGG